MSEASARLESLLAFWLDAGADVAMANTPQDRTRPVASAPVSQPLSRKLERPAVQAPSPGEHDRAKAMEQAQLQAGEAADLDSLARAIAAFDGCALKNMGARQAVFYRGAGDAPIMVIGEGP